MDVANLIERDSGEYPDSTCLVCEKLVAATGRHVFVHDAADQLEDSAAFVGLLHCECEDRYIDNAAASGIGLSDDA